MSARSVLLATLGAHIIPLTRGLFASVDAEDFERFGSIRWQAKPAAQRGNKFYACGYVGGRMINMHRVIMEAPAGLTVDHVNGDGLDNRRANLRIATRSQNNANRVSVSASGFRGVHKTPHGYRAVISAPDQMRGTIHLGHFDRLEDAARAYDRAALAQWGEFARLNFPPQAEAA